MNEPKGPEFSRRSSNAQEAQEILAALVREIKSASFGSRDYNWKQEVERRQSPGYRHPVGTPYGESPLLANRLFERVTAEYVLGHEGWNDVIETFKIEGFDQETHGKEFDMLARRRMIIGSKWLSPMLWEHLANQSGKKVLEFGPFTDPLVIPETYPDLDITYLDNEGKILEYLKQRFTNAKTAEGNFWELEKTQGLESGGYDAMVMSQILNYTDFRRLLAQAKLRLKPGGLLFINNVAQYGIPEYFTPEGKRPNSEWDTLQGIQESGFEIVEWIIIPSTDPKNQPLDRLLVVAKNK